MYEHQCVLSDAQVITDIRPIFTDDGGAIQKAMVQNTLALSYSDGSDRRELHLAVDQIDIERIRAACERAMVKVATLQHDLPNLPWIRISSGDADE